MAARWVYWGDRKSTAEALGAVPTAERLLYRGMGTKPYRKNQVATEGYLILAVRSDDYRTII